MGCGSSFECTSPRCRRGESGSRCYKHGHNYSWWCKYCKQEEDSYFKETENRIRENERQQKEYRRQDLLKQKEQEERRLRQLREEEYERMRWIKH